jgi:ribosomal protein L30
MAKLRISYTKSAIGYSQDQKDTIRSLGLRKLNSVAVQDDTPTIRGMVFKVRHLVTVEQVADDTPATTRTSRQHATLVVQPANTEAPADLERIVDTASIKAFDDLERIEGIGPKIATLLRDAGITTFAQLASSSVDDLTNLLQQAGLRLANPETWPQQAELAAAGKWDEFERLTDQLKGGRPVEGGTHHEAP